MAHLWQFHLVKNHINLYYEQKLNEVELVRFLHQRFMASGFSFKTTDGTCCPTAQKVLIVKENKNCCNSFGKSRTINHMSVNLSKKYF